MTSKNFCYIYYTFTET